ncbi:MAG: T9SS type A sorting domain-containing protein, partial [Actinobacteria bacterium]|nr:T9SS type A sorting domain-containing protein [Actinomycetota bacterium]
KIYSIDPLTGIATQFGPNRNVNGGDLVEVAGELWIITRNNNTFTNVLTGDSFTVPVNEINGASVLENGNVLLADGNGQGLFKEVDLGSQSVVATYETGLELNNGDLAGGCTGGDDEDLCADTGECYGVTVDYVQGTTQGGGAIAADRANPMNALGEPEGTDELVFTTLGYGGSLTFQFDGVVPNGPGDDIEVVETSFGNPGCEAFPEYADVSVSVDGATYFYIGTVCKSDPFVDISDADVEIALECVSHVRVASNDGLTSTGDAYDVDGIVALHNCDDNGDDDGGATLAGLEANNTLTSFPNPTSGLSQAVFVTAATERATLEVYDMNGRVVETLFNQVANANQEYRIDFDGMKLPNGVYVYRLTTDSEITVEKFMIAK